MVMEFLEEYTLKVHFKIGEVDEYIKRYTPNINSVLNYQDLASFCVA